jgi:hypothetical protein
MNENMNFPALGTPEWDAWLEADGKRIAEKRLKMGAAFLPRAKRSLESIGFGSVRVELYDDSKLEDFMEGTIWDVPCAVILENVLLLARHKSQYVLFKRYEGTHGCWDKSGIAIPGHRYEFAPTGAMRSSLDDALWAATRYLLKCGLASKKKAKRVK